MTSDRLLILIANDDGITAGGLRALIDAVNAMELPADVYAVAPAGHCSGMSSAITCDSPLEIIDYPDYHGARMRAVTGTPVDCVKLALHAIVPRRPDLMLSGINHGSNSGNSNIYSGTMGAAMEACMAGIPAAGFSLLDYSLQADFSPCVPVVRKVVSLLLDKGLAPGLCLNVNVPKVADVSGIKVTTCACGRWKEEYADYVSPHGKKFYWLTGVYEDYNPDDSASDNYWLKRGYATVTPIRPDQTAFDAIPALSSLLS